MLALSGGVGGAKLALGLAKVVAPGCLTVVANTADDFIHLGLYISPDLDTLIYTLAGLENPETGWGRRDETWSFMESLGQLGGETWFRLGDRDLAMHVERTRRLSLGHRLSEITRDTTARLGVPTRLLPMSDNPVRTVLATNEGMLEFQRYFVERKCTPQVTSIIFAGSEDAVALPDVLAAISDPSLSAIVVCPSNPCISVNPILAVPGIRDALRQAPAPVIAVSPIISGKAVKGPTAKMMRELGLAVDAAAPASLYADFLDGFIVDHADRSLVSRVPVPAMTAQTLMRTLQDRMALAHVVIEFADALRRDGRARSRSASA
ncbi:MAG: 2-phospho-L-lactate transferase [Xanthobacteraceae bacterium]